MPVLRFLSASLLAAVCLFFASSVSFAQGVPPEAYKAKKGFYPPDNQVSSARPAPPPDVYDTTRGLTNVLYYELKGTIASGTTPVKYTVLDGVDFITDATLAFL